MTLLDFGSERDDRSPVYTRSGTIIKQLELNDYQIQREWQTFDRVRRRTDANLKSMADRNRRIRKVRSLSPYMYNCVGMIFSSRRAWIEIDELEQILAGDFYRKINMKQLDAGDIVIYTRNGTRTHIGLIIFIEREANEIRNALCEIRMSNGLEGLDFNMITSLQDMLKEMGSDFCDDPGG